jgi:hypothetical protein
MLKEFILGQWSTTVSLIGDDVLTITISHEDRSPINQIDIQEEIHNEWSRSFTTQALSVDDEHVDTLQVVKACSTGLWNIGIVNDNLGFLSVFVKHGHSGKVFFEHDTNNTKTVDTLTFML